MQLECNCVSQEDARHGRMMCNLQFILERYARVSEETFFAHIDFLSSTLYFPIPSRAVTVMLHPCYVDPN